MGNELAVTQKETRLAVPAPEFSNEQIRLLGETVAKGCDQNELAFFLHVAKLKRLDPFTGQIHVVKRWDSTLGKEKMTVQTGVDGYRVIAARTNDLAGIDDPEYDTETEEHPNVAKVTVYRYGRNDDRIPYRATARWGEYVQMYKDKQTGELKPNPMWKKMPYLMLGKVAEALALRKAFPDELSGMYTNEEMDQADNEAPTPHSGKPPVQQPQRASEVKKQQGAQLSNQTQQSPAHDQKQKTETEDEFSGVIESAKESKAKDGTLWVSGKGLLVMVPAGKVDSDMKPGYFIKLRGVKKHSDKAGDYAILSSLIELSPVQEAEVVTGEVVDDGKLSPEMDEWASGLIGDPDQQGKDAVQGLVDSGKLTPASQLPTTTTKPGTIGSKRAKRLYAIAGQNRKATGFTEENIHKVLAALPKPLEHLSDLEVGMYAEFEKLCAGESDWKDLLKDE